MPTGREEAFRFTDITPIIKSDIKSAPVDVPFDAEWINSLSYTEIQNRIVVLDGKLRWDLSNLSSDMKQIAKEGLEIPGMVEKGGSLVRSVLD